MTQRDKRTILLVEDEALIAAVEKQQLGNLGYSVEHVRTGEAAVTAALSVESPPDLILMDIDLGEGIDGTEAARRIVSELDVPVVFLSSHTEPEIVEKTEKITSYGYVVKNSGITVLDASIKMAFKLFEARKQGQQHEAALLHSRDLMRYVIEHNRSAVAIHDRNLNYIYVSKQYLDQYNLKDRNIIGKHHYEVFPDLPQKFRDAHQRALGGESSTGELDSYEHADGTIAWTRWECRPWYEADQSVGGFIVYTEVLSKEHAIHIKSRDTINYLRSILRTTRDGFAVFDRHGNFLDANDAYCEMCGYSREELLQLSVPDIALEDDPELIAERIQRIKCDGHALFHARNTRKDGTAFDVEVSASFLGGEEDKIVVFFRDITERKLAENRLQQVLNEYNTVFNGTQDSMFLVNVIDEGTYQYIRNNRTHAETTGLTPESFMQKTPQELLGHELGDIIAANYRRCVRAAHPISYEETLDLPGGTKTWYTTLTPVFYQDTIQYLVGSGQDITERKQAEEEIQRQLAEKETLLKEVHHRIKNNMVQVEGLLSLQAESTDNLEVQTALQEAISRIHSIKVVYDKLLIGTTYQDLSVKDYVESLVDSLSAMSAGSQNIHIEKKIADFTLSSKKLTPLGIIINELFTNVCKYAFTGRDGGCVRIELDKNETHATLSIEDDGVGLYYDAAADQTTGFGLTIVQMLVEQLHGTYSVENYNGTRSVIEFEL